MGRTSEGYVTETIMRHLKKIGPHAFFWKVHGSAFQLAGVPDIVGVYKGHWVSFEVKVAGKNKTSKIQDHIIKLIRNAGGTAEVVYQWSDCQKIIARLDKS